MQKTTYSISQRVLVLIVVILAVIGCSNKTNKAGKLPKKLNYSEIELYNELVWRSLKMSDKSRLDTLPKSMNKSLAQFDSKTIYEMLRVIYGEDDRKNFYDADVSNELRADAEKVACLVNKSQLKRNADGTYNLISEMTYGQKNKLCDEEKFAGEPAVSFCSGFAVSSKLFVTAGHCVNDNNISNTLIVYGYRIRPNGEPNLTIAPEDIYEVEKIKGLEQQSRGNDYAVLEIKNSFPESRIAPFRKTGIVDDSESLHVVGYPCGLPVKITTNASVYNNNNRGYFVINADTYKGNSGSPVFNSKTHVVEGILVRGEADFNFIQINDCRRSVRCPNSIDYCRGEDVSRVSQFQHLIK